MSTTQTGKALDRLSNLAVRLDDVYAVELVATARDEQDAIRKAARTLDRERTGLYVMGGEVDEAWALLSRIASEAP